jgi:hypothetical protein
LSENAINCQVGPSEQSGRMMIENISKSPVTLDTGDDGEIAIIDGDPIVPEIIMDDVETQISKIKVDYSAVKVLLCANFTDNRIRDTDTKVLSGSLELLDFTLNTYFSYQLTDSGR